jgi:16S rRNA (cytosine1402-N4)-methyltransferase
MRMDQDQELKAAHVLNTYSAAALQDLFSRYGEVTNAAGLAQKIIIGRLQEPILHTQQFKDLIKPLVRRGKENQYYAQVFQALRIEVNKELEALEELLLQSTEMLVTGGRLVVISYHSLEDRLIKNFFAKGKFKGEVEKDLFGNELKPYTSVFRKAQMPAAPELEENNRSRSAKLRAGEKR